MKHTKKELRRLMNENSDRSEMATEIIRLRAELDKAKKELYYARMDRDITKKAQALFKTSASKPKRK